MDDNWSQFRGMALELAEVHAKNARQAKFIDDLMSRVGELTVANLRLEKSYATVCRVIPTWMLWLMAKGWWCR